MHFLDIILLCLGLSLFILSLRMIKGPTIWDRLLVLNIFTSKVVIITVCLSLYYEEEHILNPSTAFDYLDIGITYALLGFITTVLIARFIERKEHL